MRPLQHVHLQWQDRAGGSGVTGAQTPVRGELQRSCPSVCVCPDDPGWVRGYDTRCGTSGQTHPSDWAPGLTPEQMPLLGDKGQLTRVLRVWGVSEPGSGRAVPFVRTGSRVSHGFHGTCSGSDPCGRRPRPRVCRFGGLGLAWQVWECSAATLHSDQITSLAGKAWGGSTGPAKLPA